jgi:DNA-binding transcriptional ArsR family regulator
MRGKSKNRILDPNVLELVANRFRILGEPVRLRILAALNEKEMSVSDLTDVVGSSQPNVSKHLRILQEAGLVGRRQEGNTVYCFISDPSVFELCDLVCGSLSERLQQQVQVIRALTPPR